MKLVKSVVEFENTYRDGMVFRYGLVLNKTYQVAEDHEIPVCPDQSGSIWIRQFDGKVIPYEFDNFIPIETWREEKINEILK